LKPNQSGSESSALTSVKPSAVCFARASSPASTATMPMSGTTMRAVSAQPGYPIDSSMLAQHKGKEEQRAQDDHERVTIDQPGLNARAHAPALARRLAGAVGEAVDDAPVDVACEEP